MRNYSQFHQDIFVSSMMDSPVSALYHSLQKIYCPLLLRDSKFSTEFDPKLQSLITELEKGLGSILRSGQYFAQNVPLHVIEKIKI